MRTAQTFTASHLHDAGIRVGEAEFRGGHSMARHVHDSGYLCLVMRGGYDELLDGWTRRLTSGSIYYVPPEWPHATLFDRDGAFIFRVELEPEAIERFRRRDVPVDRPWVRSGGTGAWAAARAFASARSRCLTPDTTETFVLEALACGDSSARPRVAAVPRWLRRTRDALDGRDAEPLGLDRLAHDAAVHPVHLIRAFRAEYGCTPGEYVHSRRVARACELLVTATQSVASVAASLGYHDQSHFTRMFRARIGMSPSAYRRAQCR